VNEHVLEVLAVSAAVAGAVLPFGPGDVWVEWSMTCRGRGLMMVKCATNKYAPDQLEGVGRTLSLAFSSWRWRYEGATALRIMMMPSSGL
jgi:hypothetical protein